MGGDFRFEASFTQVPQARSVQTFSVQQARVCKEADVIPNGLLAYVDEQVAPGGAKNDYGNLGGLRTGPIS